MGLIKKDHNFKAPPVSPERFKELQLFQKYVGLRFRRLDLLNLAFTHRSYTNEFQGEIDNNEKLEFLGDSVLGLVVNEYLYLHLTDKTEGHMSKIKSFVVSETSLESIAKQIKIENFILIGKGEEYSGGRTKKAIIADAMEALIGAYYLDSGFANAKKFIHRLFIPEINKVLENKHQKDYKTLLQEYIQKRYKTYPKYTIIQKKGPDHDKTFWISVVINGKPYGPGQGKNKKEAEQNAAQIAYKTLTDKKQKSE